MNYTIRLLFSVSFCVSVLIAGNALGQTPHTHEHRFSDADSWAKVFDAPERDRAQRQHDVIMSLKLTPDAKVADIGAGTDYFAARLTHMAPNGRIYAVDLEPDMVKYLAERAKREGLVNVVALQAKANSAALPERVDRILLVDTYHHIGDRIVYFKRLRDSLKLSGEGAIIDFTAESPIGPPKSERISAQKVSEEMTLAGYSQVAQHGFLP